MNRSPDSPVLGSPAAPAEGDARRLDRLIDLLPVGVWLLDEAGNIVRSNEAGRRIWGGARYVGMQEFGQYKGWWSDGRRIAAEEWPAARAITHGETRIGDEIAIECFDGTRKVIRNSATPIRDDAGRLVGALVVNEDITAMKAAERALRESAERFEIVARATNDAVWDWDLLADTVWWNDGYQTLFGYPRESAKPTAESWTDYLHPDDRAGVLADVHAFIDGTGLSWSGEYRFRRSDGSYADIYDRGFIVRDAAGRGVRMIGAMMDVSERKAVERALRESEERYRSLSQLTSDWIWETDEEHRFVDTPPRLTELIGYQAPHYVGKRRWEVAGLEPLDGDWEAHRRMLARRESFRDWELLQVKEDGSRKYLRVSGEPVYHPDGRFKGYRGTATEVTRQKENERALRESEARFRSLVALSSDWYWEQDAELRFTRFEGPVSERSGSHPRGALGRRRWEIEGVRPMSCTWEEHRAVLQARQPFRAFVYERIGDDGERRYVEASGEPVFDADGAFRGYRGTARDVSAERRAEEQLRRFRLAMDNSADLIALIDRETLTYVDVNETTCRVLGYRRDELLGMPVHVGSEIDSAELERQYDAAIADPARSVTFRGHFACKDGRRIAVEAQRRALRSDGRWLIVSIARDTTERDAAGEALRRFRLALDRSGELIALIDVETMRYVDANEALCAALGYSRDELLRMHPDELIPFSRAELRETYRRLIEGEEPPPIRSYYRCKDGSRFPYESRRHAVRSDGRWLIVSIERDIRRDLASEEELRKREEEFRAVAENAPDGIMRFDAALRCLYANSAIGKSSGWPREAILGRPLGDFPLEDAVKAPLEAAVRRTFATGETQTVDFAFTGARGERFYHARLAPERDAQGRVASVLGVSRDVTDRRLAERAMAESEARLRSIVYASAAPLLLVDGDGRTLFANPAAGALFGCAPKALEGTHLGLPLGSSRPSEVSIVLPGGGTLPAEMQFAATQLDGREVLVVSLHDLSERKRFEKHIQQLATHDGLTGLPNRAVLGDRSAQAIASARRNGSILALLFVDLDQFKLVNDSFGHAAGDALLNEVARRLLTTVREGDTVARLGGDEFVILLTDLARPGDSATVARKVAEALDEPVQFGLGELRVTASIGISLYPDDGADLDSLLRCADAAMYRAKDSGRNAFHYYSAEMGEQARARVDMEAGLRRALEREELRLHFQPQLDFGSGRITGLEALLRWEHPQRGMVSPATFIPVAEDSGLIVPIGQWALRAACREVAGWNAAGLGPVKVSVNLSARQFWRGSVTELVRGVLEETGLPASQLELEITESVVARDLQQVMLSLEQLRRIGVSIAIDDFGTGYSSLAYLRSLPIHKLKIDKSFIQGIPADTEATALVGEIVRLAHILRLEVVAEGVETMAQAQYLRDAGCEAMQGFVFSRALPPNEAAILLRSGRRLVLDRSRPAGDA